LPAHPAAMLAAKLDWTIEYRPVEPSDMMIRNLLTESFGGGGLSGRVPKI